MSRAARLLLAILFAASLSSATVPARAHAANACADGGRSRPDEGGIGGTGVHGGDGIGGTGARIGDDDGIGGTGARPSEPADDSGIGGTGIRADTGVIGTITGFGSICVGGLEIHYDAETPVRIDGEVARAADLAVGQVVEVVAGGSGDELRASEIAVRHIVSGPVTAIEGDRLTVAGQAVQLAASTSIPTEAIAPDMSVEVSGMRRADGVIVASRVAAAEAGDAVRLSGTLSRLASGSLAIDGTEVHTRTSVQSDIGEEVRVAGRWSAGAIEVESFEPVPRVPFDGRVERLDLEGYVRAAPNGEMRVGNFAVESSALAVEKSADARVRIEATVRDRRVVVERVQVMRDFPAGPGRPDSDAHGWRKGPPDERGPRPDGPPPDDLEQFDAGPGNGPRPEPRDAPAPRMDHPEGDDAHGHPGMAPVERPDMPPPNHPDMPGERPDMPPFDRPDRGGRPDRPDRAGMPSSDRPARPDLPPPPPDRPERPAPPPDRPERPERPDGPRPDRFAPPQLPPRVDRPDLPRRN